MSLEYPHADRAVTDLFLAGVVRLEHGGADRLHAVEVRLDLDALVLERLELGLALLAALFDAVASLVVDGVDQLGSKVALLLAAREQLLSLDLDWRREV